MAWCAIALAAMCAGSAHARAPGPDVVLNDIPDSATFDAVGGIRAYTLGSGTCNIGDSDLEWQFGGSPGYAMNAFRLYDGRLEQIGMSWVKTACCAFQGTGCDGSCTPGTGLGVGCRDAYQATWNASQSALGPRSGINAFTGAFAVNPGGGATTSINRRLQIAETDMDRANFPGALYFVEGLYVSTGDATNFNWLNNASHQRVTFTRNTYILSPVAGTFNKSIPAIQAWQDHGNGLNTPDPTIQIVNVDVPSEGRFIVGARVRDNGDGTWRYDYAVYNLCSDVSGRSFSVPVPAGATVTDVGFHDVDHHSGEPYDTTDWTSTIGATKVSWSSPQTFAQNPNSNALRWGTMYNFWFTADRPPADATATLKLFKPHTPSNVSVSVKGPGVLPCPADLAPIGENDGVVNIYDLQTVMGYWNKGAGSPGDVNGDGLVDVDDVTAVIDAWGPCT
jgi:hypothetical protein